MPPLAPSILVATYCEPQKSALNWPLHALYLSFLRNAPAGADFLVTIPEGTAHYLDPRIPHRFRHPIAGEFRHPKLAEAGYEGYPYVNHFLAVEDLQPSYDFILLTDVDTLLLEPFRTFAPAGFMTGQGAYDSEYSHERLARFASRSGFTKFGRYRNVGATWYGPGAQVIECARQARALVRRLFDEEDWSETSWPKWWIGVSTMYAAEIVMNEVDDLRIEAGRLDARPAKDSNPAALHLHMFHNRPFRYEEFSKHAFQEKFYDENDVRLTGLAAIALGLAREGVALSAQWSERAKAGF